MNKYFIVTIDTECDKSKDWSIPQPLQFKNILEGIPNRLTPLFERYNVKPTYLISPEVIRDSASSALLKDLKNVELGTHLHGEFIEPQANYASTGTWEYQADYDYDTEFQKMKNLTQLFVEIFGYRPLSFRAGRFGLGVNTLRILQELNYKIDSSIFPYQKIRTKHNNFDTYYYPTKPHVADPIDIAELPLTVYSRFYDKVPAFLGRRISNSKLPLKVLSKLIGKKRIKPYSLRHSTVPLEVLKDVIDGYTRLHSKSEDIVLHAMFHSNETIVGGSPYCNSEDELSCWFDRLEELLVYSRSLGFTFVTMTEYYAVLKHTKKT